MKIACISLGCPKNQVDLDVMVHILLSAGHETVADLAEADVILVNTCGFIESAKTEAIENILEACSYKQQNPELEAAAALVDSRYRKKLAIGRRDLVVAALQRRGFAYPVIKEAIRRVEEGE